MVGATGFEPATSCAQGKRANHAAPRPAVLRIAQGFPCYQERGSGRTLNHRGLQGAFSPERAGLKARLSWMVVEKMPFGGEA